MKPLWSGGLPHPSRSALKTSYTLSSKCGFITISVWNRLVLTISFRWVIVNLRANLSTQHSLQMGEHCWIRNGRKPRRKQQQQQIRGANVIAQLTHTGSSNPLGPIPSWTHTAVTSSCVLTDLVIAALVGSIPAFINVCRG